MRKNKKQRFPPAINPTNNRTNNREIVGLIDLSVSCLGFGATINVF